MQKNTMETSSEPDKNLFRLPSPVATVTDSRDVLSQILRGGAQRMLQVAIQKEVEDYLQSRSALMDEKGANFLFAMESFPRVRRLRG